MCRFLLFCVSVVGFVQAQSQALYMPRNVQQAFKNETRSPDGKPGKNYWQNFARYNITITAMPPDRTIKGSEQISYINNSPDTLHNVVIRIIENIHKPGALRFANASEDYLTDGVSIDAFAINGKPQKWRESPSHFTWQNVRLPKVLPPHDSVQLSFDWHYQVSLESGREGMIDSTTYFLAYAYPRVSVLDDCDGWDKIDFTDYQEFYNDFNDYTLTVNVPKNYIVWSTGVLQNPNEVLQPKYAERFKSSMSSDDIIHIADKNDLAAQNITAQNNINSWRWKADYVPDVTFGLSDHYVWDASSVVVDDATQRRTSAQAAYNDTAWDFHYITEHVRHSVGWMSHNWPGIAYPYPAMTAFQGYADMEYPMIINDGATGDTIFTRFVAEHEIAHTWFPFYMGINESRYPFMDEGWATVLELLIGTNDLGKERAEGFFQQFRVERWINDPSGEEDLPIITPANIMRGPGYSNNAYGKPALGYLAVKDMLGDGLFKQSLHEFMSRWHGKHPIPWDFFNTMNDASGRNLNWFWNNWFFSNYYIDLAVEGVNKTKKGYDISIKNIGGFAAPVDVVINYEDGSSEQFHQTPEIWKDDQKQATVSVSTKKKIKSVQLNGGIFMDADESNNEWMPK